MQKIATDDLLRTLIDIRDSIEEAPLQLAILLLAVSRRQGCSAVELGRATGYNNRIFFTHLQRLGIGDHTGPGLNLIAALPHPDGRAQAHYLTKAGERLVEKLKGKRIMKTVSTERASAQ